MYINNLGHMTKMAAMPIYGKNPSKIIFSETNRLISRKLGVRHRWLKYSNVYINHDPVMTLTKFMARSTWVACASELGKLLKCRLKEKANRKLANGQNIEDSEKRKWPKGLSAPALELNTIIFKHVYWYMQLISGERLQDHWSSGIQTAFSQKLLSQSKPNFMWSILRKSRGRSRISGGSNPSRGGSFSTFYLIFHTFPYEIEIICFQRGVQANHLNPL